MHKEILEKARKILSSFSDEEVSRLLEPTLEDIVQTNLLKHFSSNEVMREFLILITKGLSNITIDGVDSIKGVSEYGMVTIKASTGTYIISIRKTSEMYPDE